MTLIIDGHEDLAFESLYEKRNYLLPVAETRKKKHEVDDYESIIGWPEYQKGQIGIIFSTIFLQPWKSANEHCQKGVTTFETPDENHQAVLSQLDFYHRWEETYPNRFRVIHTKKDLQEIARIWHESPAHYPEKTNPVGLVILWEGAEGLRKFSDLDEYWNLGMRIIGPVWEGGRWCGGTIIHDEINRFTAPGRNLLRNMSQRHFILDIAHMNHRSALEAIQEYPGTIIASHANCNALLDHFPNERHLTDEIIARLIERGGVIGVMPCNSFLSTAWTKGNHRSEVSLETLANHIDHICQIAGNAEHVAIGSDADGGFGYPDIPEEMNDISDIRKIINVMNKRGYSDNDISNLLYGNWYRILETTLP